MRDLGKLVRDIARDAKRAARRARERAEREPTKANWTAANLLLDATAYLDTAARLYEAQR